MSHNLAFDSKPIECSPELNLFCMQSSELRNQSHGSTFPIIEMNFISSSHLHERSEQIAQLNIELVEQRCPLTLRVDLIAIHVERIDHSQTRTNCIQHFPHLASVAACVRHNLR